MAGARVAIELPAAGSPLSVQEWRGMAKRLGWRSWERAARYAAKMRHSARAVILLCDDTLVVMTHADGKVSRRTYRPGTWCWA